MTVGFAKGWDVVMATSFQKINTLLACYCQPKAVNAQFFVPLRETMLPASINASVGAWTITGGIGQNVLIEAPFIGGIAVMGSETVPLDGVTLEVTVLLRLVKSTLSNGGSEYQLVIDLTHPSAILDIRLKPPLPHRTHDNQAVLTTVLRTLLASLTGVGITIAKVDPSKIPYPWLFPQYGIDYVVASTAGGDGVLCLLLATIHPPLGVLSTLASGPIPSGCDGVILLSNQIFTQEFLAPSLASSLGVPVTYLVYGGTEPMTISLGRTVAVQGATINFAQATASNGAIVLTLRGNACPMAGVTINFMIHATYVLSLEGTSINPILSFQRTLQKNSHSADIEWLMYIVLGLSDGSVGMTVMSVIMRVSDRSASNTLGDSLPCGFAASQVWPFGGTVSITQALLPTALQLGARIETA